MNELNLQDLDDIPEGAYDRRVFKGLRSFREENDYVGRGSLYSSNELEQLEALSRTPRDVERRMPMKVTSYYAEIARESDAVRAIVKAQPRETADLAGAPDPGGQLGYSPVEGVLHKYEMLLLYLVSTCSSHCRFCYRQELISHRPIRRSSGSALPKGLAKLAEVTSYVRHHNAEVQANGGIHPLTGRAPIREALLSGGDPMVLPNRVLASWLTGLAQCGVDVVRIGTKELAFFPFRFDDNFFQMLDWVHARCPSLRLIFMLHFDHPDEFLKGPGGWNHRGDPCWREPVRGVLSRMKGHDWVKLENQAPIIAGVNDNVESLRVLQQSLASAGVENHYFFCGRDVIGHRAFNVPIERAWELVNESQRGLSGVETHARLSISHFKGKTEVCAVTSHGMPGLAGGEDGVVVFKLLRDPGAAPKRGRISIVGRNPNATWFTDYADRVLFDEAGLFAPGSNADSRELS